MRGARSTVWSLTVLGVGVVAFAEIAALRVPWDPVPGGPLSLPAPEDVLSPTQIAHAEHVARWARSWSWSSLVVSIGTLGLLASSRRLRAWLERPWAAWPVRTAIGVLGVLGVERIATAPFSVAGQVLRRRHGLSTQSWLGFARDLAVSWAVSALVTTVLAVVLVGLVRRLPRLWPAVAGLLCAGLVVLGSYAYPLVVEPLFNRFTPLPDGPLHSGVLDLAAAEGVRVDEVLEADASRRTTTLNAYVSGFGDTRRVVLYDTLVDDLPTDQALSVVAHELAHAQHDDVLTGTLLGAAGAAVGVGLLGLALGRRRDGGTSPAVVPALCLLVAVGSVAEAPVQNAVSRRIETRADVEALRATGDPEAFIAMQRRLAERSLSDPTPPAWAQWWFGSHPTLLERVAIAERLAELGG